MMVRSVRNAKDGFTLIEVAIVVVLMGILLVPMLALYQQYLEKQKITLTQKNIEISSAETSYFFTNTLRYPCPADRGLPETDPNYGREFNPTCNPAAAGLAVGGCTPGGGLCLVAGQRDADGDGANDPVLVGGIPVRSLKETNSSILPDATAYDAWGSKITYAVSLSLTSNTTYRNYNGVIAAVDEFNQQTAGIQNDAQYVMVSHGPDGKGGFTLAGTVPTPCGAAADSRDHENCDLDSIFMQALGAYKANAATYYDDYSYFNKSRSSTLWAYISGTGHIYNLNTGNVGIRTDVPAERLDVVGTIRLNNNAHGSQLCRTDGTACFPVSSVTESGAIRCTGPDDVMRGISIGNELCVTPTFTAPTPNQDCGPDWVVGFTSEGAVICGP